MNVKKTIEGRLKYTLIIVLLCMISVAGLTYAYFLSRLRPNTESTSVIVGSGTVELTYDDGNKTIIIEKLFPGETIKTKTFSVENTGTIYIEDYDVYLDSVKNELEYSEDLTYVLKCKSYDKNKTYKGECTGSNGTFPKNTTKIVTNAIEVGYTHEYELTVFYEETYKDQSNDMGKSVKANIIIIDDSEISNK